MVLVGYQGLQFRVNEESVLHQNQGGIFLLLLRGISDSLQPVNDFLDDRVMNEDLTTGFGAQKLPALSHHVMDREHGPFDVIEDANVPDINAAVTFRIAIFLKHTCLFFKEVL